MADPIDDLLEGRASYAGRAWRAAFDALSRADGALSLEAADLERLATAAYMLGREDDFWARWSARIAPT